MKQLVLSLVLLSTISVCTKKNENPAVNLAPHNVTILGSGIPAAFLAFMQEFRHPERNEIRLAHPTPQYDWEAPGIQQ